MRRQWFVMAICAVSLSGCGGKTTVTVTVRVPQDALAVRKGMTKAEVRSVAGSPDIPSPYPSGRACWTYFPRKAGINVHTVRICFVSGRVSMIQTPTAGSG